MRIDSDRIARAIYPSPEIEAGLGIVETGWVAGALSALLGIGFELLGVAGGDQDANEMVVKCSIISRVLGEASQKLASFIPAIPPLKRSEVLSFAGRLDAFSTADLYGELGPTGTLAFVDGFLCEFLEVAFAYYISRASDLSDESFKRALSLGSDAVQEARRELASSWTSWDGKFFEDPLNLRRFEEILDLSWSIAGF